MGKKNKVVIAGAGGHARVVQDLLAVLGSYELAGATAPGPAEKPSLTVLGTDDILPELLAGGVTHAAVGLGSVRDTGPREKLYRKLLKLGFAVPALVHPSAAVSASASVGAGAQIMAGCVINAGARVGVNCVVNSGAVIEHDCVIGDGAFIAPGAVLGGDVAVGPGAFVGLGAKILPGVKIGAGAVVGAGALALEDVPAGALVYGSPAKTRTA